VSGRGIGKSSGRVLSVPGTANVLVVAVGVPKSRNPPCAVAAEGTVGAVTVSRIAPSNPELGEPTSFTLRMPATGPVLPPHAAIVATSAATTSFVLARVMGGLLSYSASGFWRPPRDAALRAAPQWR